MDKDCVDAFAMFLVYKWAIKAATATPSDIFVHFLSLHMLCLNVQFILMEKCLLLENGNAPKF